jgi:zinc transporter ZupT
MCADRGNYKLNALILTSMAALSTSIGGYCAVLLQRRIHLLMAFGAGVLIGAACLDLLPSALSAAAIRGWSGVYVFAIAALGAGLILCIGQTADRYSLHGRDRTAGRVSASLLVIHSTLDGTAIFAATTISLQMGLIVGLGVVAHDICDGLNTILLSTGGRKPEWEDYGFLALDALAPVAGGLIAAHLFSVSPALVMVFLSLAAGSFLFTAIFGLFPDAWQNGRRATIPWVGLAGFLLVWCLTRALGSLA